MCIGIFTTLVSSIVNSTYHHYKIIHNRFMTDETYISNNKNYDTYNLQTIYWRSREIVTTIYSYEGFKSKNQYIHLKTRHVHRIELAHWRTLFHWCVSFFAHLNPSYIADNIVIKCFIFSKNTCISCISLEIRPLLKLT